MSNNSNNTTPPTDGQPPNSGEEHPSFLDTDHSPINVHGGSMLVEEYVASFDLNESTFDPANFDEVEQQSRKHRTNSAGEQEPDIEFIKAALAVIPSDSYEEWYRIAGALYQSLDDDGYELFVEWSKKSTKYNAEECDQKWKEGKKITDIPLGWIFLKAKEADPTWRERYKRGPPLEIFNAGEDVEKPQPRAWLLGNIFARKFLSSLFGDGGVGKTALRYAQYLSLATGRNLTAEHVFQRCRVLIVSLEDDIDELRRRIWALTIHYNISRQELNGWLFYAAPGTKGGKLLIVDKYGNYQRGPLKDKLQEFVVAHSIDLVGIDPFIKSHGIAENDNNGIDQVTQVLIDLMFECNIAIDVPHHISKAAAKNDDPGDANRGRGASSFKDGLRLAYILTVMSQKEAETFGIKEQDRKSHVRMDSGKVNITRQMREAKWFKLIGVPLGNATEMYPHGDEVQTVEPWYPPAMFQDLSDEVIERILQDIDKGMEDGSRFTDAPTARTRAAWKVVQGHTDKTEAQARELIKTWVEQGMLERRDYTNEKSRKEESGLWWNKVPF